MAQFQDVLDFVTRSGLKRGYGRPFPEEAVAEAESALGLRLPRSYREFLTQSGSGSLGPEEFLVLARGDGIAGCDSVWYTLAARKYALPASMIVVQDRGEGAIYCLDTSRADGDGEAPVVEWVLGTPPVRQDARPLAPSFADYVLQRLERLCYRSQTH